MSTFDCHHQALDVIRFFFSYMLVFFFFNLSLQFKFDLNMRNACDVKCKIVHLQLNLFIRCFSSPKFWFISYTAKLLTHLFFWSGFIIILNETHNFFYLPPAFLCHPQIQAHVGLGNKDCVYFYFYLSLVDLLAVTRHVSYFLFYFSRFLGNKGYLMLNV